MDLAATRGSHNAAAQRGLMVQRVLVDGWSAAAVAASYRVDERQVAALVAAYRRRGMAALRGEAPPQGARQRAWELRNALVRVVSRLRHWVQTGIGGPEPGRCIEFGRRNEDARHQK